MKSAYELATFSKLAGTFMGWLEGMEGLILG